MLRVGRSSDHHHLREDGLRLSGSLVELTPTSLVFVPPDAIARVLVPACCRMTGRQATLATPARIVMVKPRRSAEGSTPPKHP